MKERGGGVKPIMKNKGEALAGYYLSFNPIKEKGGY